MIKKICLIKVSDRLDNLRTLHIFDQAKKQKIKQNTLSDILPLAIFLGENNLLFDNIIKICTNKSIGKIGQNYKLPSLLDI